MSTLNKMTKAQLVEHAVAQGREVVALRHALAEARANAETLRAQRRNAEHGEPCNWPEAPRPARVLPAHFVAAREAAMRLGRAVKVAA